MKINPIKVPKASGVLATALRERILSGEIAEGEALPSERDLVEQAKLSRATVREALRILEVQGLLTIKQGRTGGAFVRRPGSQAVADSVELLVRGGTVRLTALHETREAVEPFCASLAARSRTDADLAELDEANGLIRDAGDVTAFLRANVRWHVAVARASHNELLSGFMQAISEAIFAATAIEDFITSEVRTAAFRAHEVIADAIRSGDPEAAQRRMLRHVHGFAESVKLADRRHAIALDRSDVETSPDES